VPGWPRRLAAEDKRGKLGHGRDPNEEIGEGAKKVVPSIEWLQWHLRSASLREVFGAGGAAETFNNSSCSNDIMPEKPARVHTTNPLRAILIV